MAVPVIGQLIDAIHTTLSGDGTLTGLLGTYESLPCTFSGRKVPSAAPVPYVTVRPVSNMTPFDTKIANGMVFTIDVGCYTGEIETTIVLEQIVDRVTQLLHRADLTLATDDMITAKLVSSVEAPTDDFISGQILTFDFLIMNS